MGLTGASMEEVLAYVKYRIENSKKFSLVTPNPEIVLASNKDNKLKEALNKANLAIPDGIGLAQASRFLSLKAPKGKILRFVVCAFQGIIIGGATFFKKSWLTDSLNILPGRKVFLDLIKLADDNSWKVFLLGGYEGLGAKVIDELKKKYKKVRFDWVNGPVLDKNGALDTKVDIVIQKMCVEKINRFAPKLLFVALGPTKQEKWLANNLSKLNVGGAMAVGGTFNYVAGVSKLPPKWMEEAGLEWIWRVAMEPWRIGRIVNAVIIFPWKVFLYKMSKSADL